MASATPLMIATLTDVGRQREHNEDAVDFDPHGRWAIVADGMGGHLAGEVASEIVVQTVRNVMACVLGPEEEPLRVAFPEPSGGWLAFALRTANSAVRRAAAADREREGMGSTGVAIMLANGRLHIAHVGDSRCYRLRDGTLQQLTRDHSAAAEMEALAGEDERLREFLGEDGMPPPNLITRALGIYDTVDVDVRAESLVSGDLYLLCSDGLSGMVKDNAIANIMKHAPTLEQACEALISAANAGGGEDNITAALVRVP